MPSTTNLREATFGLALALMMWLTRSHEIVSVITFPDVTWAAFFLAGIFSRRWLLPVALLINAAVIDYVAIVYGGVSDYCVTPAYVFLIPTYLALWGCGRWVQIERLGTLRSLVRSALALTVGVIAAFVISNASFYAFSGYFAEMSLLTYAAAVARYLPQYFEGAVLYAGTVLGAFTVWRAAHDAVSARKGSLR